MTELFDMSAKNADQKNLAASDRTAVQDESSELAKTQFLAEAISSSYMKGQISQEKDLPSLAISFAATNDSQTKASPAIDIVNDGKGETGKAVVVDQTNWRWRMPDVVDSALDLNLTREEKERIGKKIWKNESGGTYEGLTFWNKGEEFPSLGIGHFIWMPKNVNLPFGNSFPGMIKSLRDAGKTPPAWLKENEPCPWDTRTEFMRDINGKNLSDLRKFLSETVVEQTEHIIKRLETSLPKILGKIEDPDLKNKVQERFYRVLNSGPAGVFALVDYVNFKGEGLELVPEYNNVSWGLRQVLEGMKDTADPVKDYSDSAKEVLTNRVKNSPKHRNEQQWLKGWHNRVDRYVTDPPLL